MSSASGRDDFVKYTQFGGTCITGGSWLRRVTIIRMDKTTPEEEKEVRYHHFNLKYVNLLDRKYIFMLQFLSVTARGNISTTLKKMVGKNKGALYVLHVNSCLWNYVCVVRSTDMPLWSKGRDGRCRAVGQTGLCLRRCGASNAGCRPIFYTALQHVQIYP